LKPSRSSRRRQVGRPASAAQDSSRSSVACTSCPAQRAGQGIGLGDPAQALLGVAGLRAVDDLQDGQRLAAGAGHDVRLDLRPDVAPVGVQEAQLAGARAAGQELVDEQAAGAQVARVQQDPARAPDDVGDLAAHERGHRRVALQDLRQAVGPQPADELPDRGGVEGDLEERPRGVELALRAVEGRDVDHVDHHVGLALPARQQGQRDAGGDRAGAGGQQLDTHLLRVVALEGRPPGPAQGRAIGGRDELEGGREGAQRLVVAAQEPGQGGVGLHEAAGGVEERHAHRGAREGRLEAGARGGDGLGAAPAVLRGLRLADGRHVARDGGAADDLAVCEDRGEDRLVDRPVVGRRLGDDGPAGERGGVQGPDVLPARRGEDVGGPAADERVRVEAVAGRRPAVDRAEAHLRVEDQDGDVVDPAERPLDEVVGVGLVVVVRGPLHGCPRSVDLLERADHPHIGGSDGGWTHVRCADPASGEGLGGVGEEQPVELRRLEHPAHGRRRLDDPHAAAGVGDEPVEAQERREPRRVEPLDGGEVHLHRRPAGEPVGRGGEPVRRVVVEHPGDPDDGAVAGVVVDLDLQRVGTDVRHGPQSYPNPGGASVHVGPQVGARAARCNGR
jgi:hypothetical protein